MTMSRLYRLRDVPKRTYVQIPGDIMPEPQNEFFQMYVANTRNNFAEITLIGHQNDEYVTLRLSGSHRDMMCRVFDRSDSAVELFINDPDIAKSNSIILDSGWHMYADSQETDDGYDLSLLNDWGDEVTYHAQRGERLDRSSRGWYNSFVLAREAEMDLRNALGFDRQAPIFEVVRVAYETPEVRHLLNRYNDRQRLISSAPVIRQ